MAFSKVSQSDVEAVFDTDIADLTPFIDAAHRVLVDEVQPESDLSDSRLQDIEKHLAAHMASTMDPRVSEFGAGDTRVRFQGKSGEGLRATRYGQAALALDTSGVLRQKAAVEGDKSRLNFHVTPRNN